MIILIYPRILWFLVINHLFTFKNTVSTGQNKKWLPLYWSFHLLVQEYDCLICEFFLSLIHSPIMWPSVTRPSCRAYVFHGRRPPKFLVTRGHKILWDTGVPYSWPEAAIARYSKSHIPPKTGVMVRLFTNLLLLLYVASVSLASELTCWGTFTPAISLILAHFPIIIATTYSFGTFLAVFTFSYLLLQVCINLHLLSPRFYPTLL